MQVCVEVNVLFMKVCHLSYKIFKLLYVYDETIKSSKLHSYIFLL